MLPLLLNHLAARNLFVPASLVKATSVHIRVGDNEAYVVLSSTFREPFSNAEKRSALTSAAVLRTHGKYVHVPSVASLVREFQQRHEHGRKRFRRGQISIKRVADEAGGWASVDLSDNRVLIRKADRSRAYSLTPHTPWIAPRPSNFCPQIHGEPLARDFNKFRQTNNVLDSPPTERKLNQLRIRHC